MGQFFAKRWLAWVSVLCIFAGGMRGGHAAEEGAKRVWVVYGDKSNAGAFSTLLLEAGLKCRMKAQEALEEEWKPEADLVVFLACCEGGFRDEDRWSATLLDRLGSARVLACGNAGAALLGTKKLLVGLPHGAHWPSAPVSATFTADVLKGPARRVLERPHNLLAQAENKEEVEIEIQAGRDEVESIGIYDGGAFPKGMLGIGRQRGERHHWLIAKQGNYTLWGADSEARDLTAGGRKLFANLCWFLAHAEPEPLVFPEKVMVETGRRKTLVGGSQDLCYLKFERTGEVTVRLAWEHEAKMMLMVRGAIVRRVDGESPLEITIPVNDAMQGRELEIEVTSFALQEGEKVPYEMAIEWKE